MLMARLIALGSAWILAMLLSTVGWAEELVVPGSGNPELVLRRLALAFNAVQSRHQVVVPPSTGTAGALRGVGSGAASLGRVGRPLNGEELKLGLVFIPIGRDPVVFVAGAGVSVRSITPDQALAVFRGEILDWGDLGGNPGPIRPIGREPTDASRQTIMRLIPAFTDITYGPAVKVVHLDPEMITLLDRFPTSLGTLNRSALHDCRTPVVPLAFDGVAATAETVRSGRYPLWLEFGLIHRNRALTPGGEAFIDFIRSPEGTGIIRDLGVVPPATGD